MISISFDPVNDTADVIRNFAERNGAELDAWTFLRGNDRDEIIELARDFGVAVMYNEAEKTFVHNNPIILVDADGNIRDWMNGSPNVLAGDKDITKEDIYKQLKKIY